MAKKTPKHLQSFATDYAISTKESRKLRTKKDKKGGKSKSKKQSRGK